MEATRKSNHSEVSSGLAPVVQRVAAGAHDAVDKAAGAASAAAKMVDKKGGALLAVQQRYLDGCRERVRDNPLAALGVAMTAGVLISFLLNRR
jgi:ElaB/YqjD/DUF883 family membrane-anchored ribosome-binding protein